LDSSEISARQPWSPPVLVVYGRVEDITAAPPIKNKKFGGADDVLVANLQILANAS
jgi:hypothetical protein